MSWLVSAKQYIPAVIGEPFGGGFFAGYISHTADGNPTHALIVAPRETGATGTGYTLTTMQAWASNTTTSGVNYSTTTIGSNASKDFDGLSVMNQIVGLGNIENFPAFEFCKNLAIGGLTDWYLPSRLELDIAYFNLKPDTTENVTTRGVNPYSVPVRNANFSLLYPGQTYVSSFSSSAERFEPQLHWSSTEETGSFVFRSSFASLTTGGAGKSLTVRVRAFRRIAL